MKIKDIVPEGFARGVLKLATKLPAKTAPSLAGKIAKGVGKTAWLAAKNPVKTSALAAATSGAYHKLADKDDPSLGTALGRGIGDVTDFYSDVYKGVRGQSIGQDIEQGTDAVIGNVKKNAGGFSDELDSIDNDFVHAKTPWTLDNVDRIKKQSDADYNRPWTEPDLKEQSKKKSDFEIEVERNFPDPRVRTAILAKAKQESGGRNIGEMDWTSTSNKRLKNTFPQLRKLDNQQLDSLKSQGNEAFLNYAYKDLGGYKFRGRGPIQITGKANYQRIDDELGLKGALVKDPDILLKDPKLANAASVQYLKWHKLDQKTFPDQTAAHQAVIHAVGGEYYRPGSKLGNQALAQIQKIDPSIPATTAVAATTLKGQGGKPTADSSADKTTPPSQPRDIGGPSQPRDVGGPSQPRDVGGRSQTYVYSGPTVKDIMRKFDQADAAKKAELAFTEPKSVVPTPAPPKYEPGPNQRGELSTTTKDTKGPTTTQGQITYPDDIDSVAKPKSAKISSGSGYTQLPESLNNEIELNHILILAGRKK